MSITYRETTLPNGLRIVAEVMPAAHTAGLGFFVKTGARDEDAAIMGVSHFLEHMMFKGTEHRTAAEVDRHFDEIGAEHNAFTSAEMTAFWAHCLPEHLPRAEEILSDIMRPALRSEDFDAEKSVILEEIAMYMDHPFWVLYERAMEEYYGKHPLSHRVLGTNESITALERDRMLEYFQSRYSADNTVIALAGNVDFDETTARIAEHCGDWPRTEARRTMPAHSMQPSEFTIEQANVNRHYTLMVAPGPAMSDDHRYAASILSHILGDSDGSRLYWALVDTGLAEEAVAQYEGRDGTGEMLIFFACSPADASEVRAVTLAEIRKFGDDLTEDDLERTRSKMATSVTLAGEQPAGRMRRLGRQRMYRDDYRSLEDELDCINAVTLDELRETLEAFPIDPIVTAHLAPQR